MRIEGSDRKGGAGLGLAIVKGFAEAMGATVTAANRPGDAAQSSHCVFRKIWSSSRSAPMPAKPPKVLVVDDEPQIPHVA